ncbi:GH32 C-terminal domain-containing protein [Actinomyces slackii]|uniref:Levanase n=1 Tax=Actinomyces slackii TaxID=52774 RepID=A0A448K9L4_9ACTO|nr:GH32 C-terminal domain-containing protein [Actinomyces slackii]VEG73602.1 Levanase precursor [Actinomyces slackii]
MRRMTRPLSALAVLVLAIAGAALPSGTGSAQEPEGEQWRPTVHYTPERNWMNDPNGLVYYDGEYHLFYQYNPEGSQWGNMSWGHAISTDLVHWKEQEVAIPYTDEYGVFSGSAVVDHENTSGLGSRDNPPMVAVWTRADNASGNQSQSLAYSTDKGRTWALYNNGDPVLDIGSTEFRDPKVFWDETSSRWTMVVAHSTEHRVSFYSSPDLIHWTEESSFGPEGDTSAVWECPDLFPLPVDGDPQRTKWVLVVTLGDSAQYFVGDWDGSTFTPDEEIPHYDGSEGAILADFEDGYGSWKPQGEAFGTAPATGDLPGHLGAGYVDSFGAGDHQTGSLTSEEFTISAPYINALVGGGDHPYDPAATGDNGGGTLLAGFDGSWDGWTVEGQALGDAPATGAHPGQQTIVNQQGSGLLNTFYDTATGQGTDTTTATATSPEFTIDQDYINLLIGGGAKPRAQQEGPAVVELLVDGKVVRSATGKNLEELNWQTWDVADLKGEKATIRAVDESTGDWGHVLLDEVRLSNRPASPFPSNTSLNVVVDGTVVASTTGNGSGSLQWTSMDVSAYQGRTATLVMQDNNATANWGHFMVDQIIASRTKAFSGADVVPRLDYGRDYYAAVTWNDAPDGQRYQIGWMSNWDYVRSLPTTTWRSAMSVVRRLSLSTIDGRAQLVAEPVEALEKLRTGKEVSLSEVTIPEGTTPLKQAKGRALDITVALDPGDAEVSGLKVLQGKDDYTLIGYDTAGQQVVVDRSHSGITDFSPSFPGRSAVRVPLDDEGLVRLRIIVDAHSVEVFAADGSRVITDTVYPDQDSLGVGFYAEGGEARVESLSLWHLRAP